MIAHLHRMATLVAVVEHGSFGAAARALGFTTSAVSQQIKALEQDLGVVLFNRSTRRWQLTSAGIHFHEECARMVAAARRAGQVLEAMRDEPQGELRMTAPAGFARVLGEALTPVLARHPGMRLHLVADDALVDLVGERIDLAIRFGRLPDSNWVAKPLGALHMVLCAAPSYLAKKGIPLTPADLSEHDGIALAHGVGPSSLTLLDPEGRTHQVSPRWVTRVSGNSQLWVQQMTQAGLGVGLVAAHEAYEALQAGSLVPVLPGWRMPGLPAYALTPQRGPHPARVRLALQALLQYMVAWPTTVFEPLPDVLTSLETPEV